MKASVCYRIYSHLEDDPYLMKMRQLVFNALIDKIESSNFISQEEFGKQILQTLQFSGLKEDLSNAALRLFDRNTIRNTEVYEGSQIPLYARESIDEYSAFRETRLSWEQVRMKA